MTQAILTTETAQSAPRAIGTLKLSTKRVATGSGIAQFRTSGATKVAFPRRRDAVEAIMLNTSGGLTGGDRFEIRAEAGPGSELVLTTQAAERAYRSLSGAARVTTELRAGEGATLHWLPQEFILFDGASVERRLSLDLESGAEAVLVEPLVFGRAAMGETLKTGHFRDRITIRRDGVPIYWDRIALSGAISAQLARPAVANGNGAMASVICASPRAEAHLEPIRRALPATGGASLLAPDLLILRLVAGDAFLLRRSLVPMLERLTGRALPKSWSL